MNNNLNVYKILLIDDEKSIVKGLVELLSQRMDSELQIYAAWTVSEGLKIAREVKLDLLCTDINMPVMDGFSFAKEVHSYWKECRIIFLTGYDTFDYIYKSMHEFGGNYVLKNEEDKFLDMIKKCIYEIEEELQNRVTKLKILQIEDENKKYYRQRMLSDFLQNKDTGVEVLRALFEESDIQIAEPVYGAIGCVLKSDNSPKEKEKKVYQVVVQIKDEYQYFYALDCMRIYGDSYVFFVQKKQEIESMFSKILEGFQNMLLHLMGEKISFLYAEKTICIENLREELKLYDTLLNIKLLKHNPILVDMEELMEYNRTNYNTQEQYELQIDRMLIEKQFVDVRDIFEGLYLSVKNTSELSLADTQMYYKCLGKAAYYIEKNVNYLNLPEDLQRKYYHLRYMSGIDETHAFVIQLLEYLIEKEEHITTEDDFVVKRVEDYVLNHITEEISLNALSRLVYFNPSYLSRFYKLATGRNLSQFIKEAKLMKAKELLRESEKKIGDISKMLGFESVGYFTVFFKKQTGFTPTEYRNHNVII